MVRIENVEVKIHLPGPHPELKGIVKVLFPHPHWLLETEYKYRILPWHSVSRRKRIDPEGESQERPVPGSSVFIREGTVCVSAHGYTESSS